MSGSPLRALVISHIGFEDLGTLHSPLLNRGFAIDSVEVASSAFPFDAAEASDLLVVLGGPIGVYEQTDYPFLRNEIVALANRLDTGKPTLGICLGAQLMAAALGPPVYPGKSGNEIGWAPIKPAPQTKLPEWFKPLVAPGLNVLHWHGDTFDLPAGADLLASTEQFQNHTFICGTLALGLQFHPEVAVIELKAGTLDTLRNLMKQGYRFPIFELLRNYMLLGSKWLHENFGTNGLITFCSGRGPRR